MVQLVVKCNKQHSGTTTVGISEGDTRIHEAAMHILYQAPVGRMQVRPRYFNPSTLNKLSLYLGSNDCLHLQLLTSITTWSSGHVTSQMSYGRSEHSVNVHVTSQMFYGCSVNVHVTSQMMYGYSMNVHVTSQM